MVPRAALAVAEVVTAELMEIVELLEELVQPDRETLEETLEAQAGALQLVAEELAELAETDLSPTVLQLMQLMADQVETAYLHLLLRRL
jgi:hypothetical protein